jgi:prolipoprotein diacylglyceryltransferase
MYPDLYYAFKDWFGVEWHGLQLFKTFGVLVAVSFFVSAEVLRRELKRKSLLGEFEYEEKKVIIGKPLTLAENIGNFVIGFLLGYKLVGAFFTDIDAQSYLLSLKGNLSAGILSGFIFAGIFRYFSSKGKRKPHVEQVVKVWPQDRVGELTMLAAFFGIAGAKLFNSLENWDDFMNDPIESLFSLSGLTFYGGLICAAIAIWVYAKKHRINFWNLNDAAAPMLILAYAIGRIGCQVAGDGDWGIPNAAYYSTPQGKVLADSSGKFNDIVNSNPKYFVYEFGSLDKIRHKKFVAPSFIPTWLVAYSYPHNVNNVGVRISNCVGTNCYYLPVPVFPTPIYETIMSLLIFGLLWYLRLKLKIPGSLFALYLILNGLERSLIEKIRVNTVYYIFGFRPTQAELISTAFILTGVILWFYLKSKYRYSGSVGH